MWMDAEWMKSHPHSGRLFNDDRAGGYLAFVLNMLQANYSVSEPLIVSVLTMFVFMQGIILLKGLYTAKDFDILEAMPIKKSHIVLSKLVSEYIIFFIYSVGISLPNVVYSVIKTHEYMIILNGILNIFLIPIFPMFVACLFATLFSYISRIGDCMKRKILFLILFLTLLHLY